MELAHFVRTALPVSMFLIVLSLSLRTTVPQVTSLLREPVLLFRSILAMNVVLPVIVAVAVAVFALHPAVKVALIALALSPVPPFLPGRELKLVAPAREAYVYGLFATVSVLAIFFIPLAVAVLEMALGRDIGTSPLVVARIVALTALAPLAAGLALRQWWPASVRLAAVAGAGGTALLLVAAVLILAQSWPAMMSLVGDGTLLAIVSVTLIGLAVGHVLGGPNNDDRTVLALATAIRHPAVAIAIASTSKERLVPAAIVLALVVGGIAAAPYTAWRKQLRAAGLATGQMRRSRR